MSTFSATSDARRFVRMSTDGSVELVTGPASALAADRVRVAIAYAGICGSDLHPDPGVPSPWPMGHEQSGTVVRVGPDVVDVRVGERVVVMSRWSAGGGWESGGWSDWMDVRPDQLIRIPPSLSLRDAALAEPTACIVHAIDRSELRVGTTALVLGAGPMGLLLVHLLPLCGAARVLVSEPDPARRARAEEAGALVVDPRADDVVDWVRSETDGQGADVLFESAGAPRALEDAVASARHSATIVVVGVAAPLAVASIQPRELFARELTIRGAAGWGGSWPRALALLERLRTDAIVSDILPLDEVEHGIALARGGGSGKVLLRPMDGEEPHDKEKT